jgi:hypothetical protein
MQTSSRIAFSAVLVVVLGTLTSHAGAQQREPGIPASSRASLPSDVPVVLLEAPGAPALRAAGGVDAAGRFRYGVELAVGLGLEDAGRWDTLAETGENVWRLELDSPGAFSLGVMFSRFELPPGAQVFLYDPARAEVLGAYGRSTENPNGMLAVQPLRGDRVVIEYVEPAGTEARPALVVGTLVHDYLDVLAHMTQGSVLTASCLVDVNCPAGAEHQDIKRAVIWMFRSGVGCSGSILNNTGEDGTPYMMTAEHCGDFTNGVFVFDYERATCGAGSGSQSKTISGATRLAVSSFYDGQLYRLNHAIPAGFEPFFAGWSRMTQTPSTLGISHPSGLPKKIQIDHQTPFLLNTRWSVQYDVGAVQPGSSGSPLFDVHERIIGTLSTGASSCSENGNYGRFDQFYATQNLATWLDPEGWGVGGIDGLDGIEPYAQPYDGSGANPVVYQSLNAPRLGTTWNVAIDASFQPGATSTLLVGYAAPDEGTFQASGELLVDLGSAQQFQHGSPVVSGSSAHSFALPNNIALAGRTSYTQAFVFGGGARATNAVKLVLNP